MTEQKLATIKENNPKVYNAGKLKTLSKSKYMHPTVSGSAIRVDDVNSIEHKLGVGVGSKNLLPYPYKDLKVGTITTNGITFTTSEDGSILINGTAEANITKYLYQDLKSKPAWAKEGTVITISKNSDKETEQSMIYFTVNYYDANTTMKQGITAIKLSQATGTVNADWVGVGWYIHIPKGNSIDNLTIKPMIELGLTATPYTPFITDFTGVEVSRYGKNLIPRPFCKNTQTVNGINFVSNADGTITLNGTNNGNAYSRYSSSHYNLPLPKGSYYIYSGNDNIRCTVQIKRASGVTNYVVNSTFNIEDGDVLESVWVQVSAGNTTVFENTIVKPQLELGSTATEYKPFIEPQTATANVEGVVEGLISLSPTMTLIPNNSGVVANLTYYRDIDTAIDNQTIQIALSGGE